MKSSLKIVAFTVIVSTLLAFASHVIIQGWEDQISTKYAHLFESANAKDKFGIEVLIAAGATAILPVVVSYFILYIIWGYLPGGQWWKKGFLYGLILLVIKSGLLREPIMGIIMDVPIWMVVAKQLDVWVPNIILGLVLALGVKMHRSKTHSSNCT